MDADKGGSGDGTIPEKTFTQAEVNSMIAKDKKSLREKNEALAVELETLQSTAQLTGQAKSDLEAQVKTLREEFMSKSERAVQQVNDLKGTVKASDDAREEWQKRYTSEAIDRSLSEAAVLAFAHNPKHVVPLLRNAGRIEIVDGVAKTLFSLDGKDVSASDLVTAHKAIEENASLYDNKKISGMDSNNQAGQVKTVNDFETYNEFQEYKDNLNKGQ